MDKKFKVVPASSINHLTAIWIIVFLTQFSPLLRFMYEAQQWVEMGLEDLYLSQMCFDNEIDNLFIRLIKLWTQQNHDRGFIFVRDNLRDIFYHDNFLFYYNSNDGHHDWLNDKIWFSVTKSGKSSHTFMVTQNWV